MINKFFRSITWWQKPFHLINYLQQLLHWVYSFKLHIFSKNLSPSSVSFSWRTELAVSSTVSASPSTLVHSMSSMALRSLSRSPSCSQTFRSNHFWNCLLYIGCPPCSALGGTVRYSIETDNKPKAAPAVGYHITAYLTPYATNPFHCF